MTIVLSLIALSAAFRSLQEIGKWRPFHTWLPETWITYRGPLNLDLYHFVSALHWLCMFLAGAHWIQQGIHLIIGANFLLNIALVWFIHGLLNDLFYHIIWMKPGYRDWQEMWIIQIFTGKLTV